MKVGFFPFTYVTKSTVERCRSLFEPLIVYQPVSKQVPAELSDLAADGMISLRTPVGGDEDRLVSLCREIQQWGRMYQGEGGLLKLIARGEFYNEEFIPEIRTEILKGGSKAEQVPDPMFNARLFLLLAQAFDMKNAEIDRDLLEAEMATRQLFERIKGENEGRGKVGRDGEKTFQRADDPGKHMTESRILSWFRLMEADADSPDVLLTSSYAVVSFLEERFETMMHVGGVKVNRLAAVTPYMTDVLTRLAASGEIGKEAGTDFLSETPGPDENGSERILDIYVLPECPPLKLAGFFSGRAAAESSPHPQIRNGVLACLKEAPLSG